MDTEWKGLYASPTHDISPILKEVILRICLVGKELSPSSAHCSYSLVGLWSLCISEILVML